MYGPGVRGAGQEKSSDVGINGQSSIAIGGDLNSLKTP